MDNNTTAAALRAFFQAIALDASNKKPAPAKRVTPKKRRPSK